MEALLIEHQRELLYDSSSGDEDFRCAAVTPSPSSPPAENLRLLTPKSPTLITYSREKLLLIKSKIDGNSVAPKKTVKETNAPLVDKNNCLTSKMVFPGQKLLVPSVSPLGGDDTKNQKECETDKKDAEAEHKPISKADSIHTLPVFTYHQMNVWFKYLSCINSRIKEVTEGA